MPLYAVIDTNVLVSAFLKPASVPRAVIDYIYGGEIIPLYNEQIILEYTTVLHRPKFQFPPNAVKILVSKIQELGMNSEAALITETIPDPKDAVFYAQNEHTTYLVTGNLRHFPKKNICCKSSADVEYY